MSDTGSSLSWFWCWKVQNDCDCRENSIWGKKNVCEGVFILDWIEEKDKHFVLESNDNDFFMKNKKCVPKTGFYKTHPHTTNI